MPESVLTCRDDLRRAKVRETNRPSKDGKSAALWNGIDDVEFDGNHETQCVRVYFLCELLCPDLPLDSLEIYDEQTRRSIPCIAVQSSTPASVVLKTQFPLCLNATYLLKLNTDRLKSCNVRIDPRFAQRRFATTPEVTDLDPQPTECPAQTPNELQPNYLARDYASFRQLLLDRLALTCPEWTERRIPDIGTTLIELFAYVGDYLAYFQDAVATEAYLNTARRRVSVRRHARLVDYELHEGCNARTFVQFEVISDVFLNPENAFFITQHPDPKLKGRPVLTPRDLANLPEDSYQPFEVVRFDHSRTKFKAKDIKNIVGLIGTMALKDNPFSDVLVERLPVELRDTLMKYTKCDVMPPQELAEELARKLNDLLNQYVSRQHMDPSEFLSRACWDKFEQAAALVGGDRPAEFSAFKAWMDNFFSSHNSDRIHLRAAHNTLYFYSWSQSQCFLPEGTTQATLYDRDLDDSDLPDTSSDLPWCDPSESYEDESDAVSPADVDPDAQLPATEAQVRPKCTADVMARIQKWRLRNLSIGDVLIFEEVLGAETHNKSDADPSHRQAVRLTNVQFCIDPVTNEKLVEIEWSPEDALKFPLCISSAGLPQDKCRVVENISVARGNVVMMDHGLTIDPIEWLGIVEYDPPALTCDATFRQEPSLQPSRSKLFRPTLKETDLTFAEKVDDSFTASQLSSQKAHHGLPAIQVFGFPMAADPPDAVRDSATPPSLLVTFDDYNDPSLLLDRLQSYEEDDVRRIAQILPPEAAEFLQNIYYNPKSWQTQRQTALRPEGTHQDQSRGDDCAASVTSTIRSAGGDQDGFDNFRAALQGALVWNPRIHLLDSYPNDQHFVVEMDNDRRAQLRFGDDDLGRRPPPQTSFYARYRRGNGIVGNVGADRIAHLVARGPQGGSFRRIRNPLPAQGSSEFEQLDHARLFAPQQFKKQRRAIIAADYVSLVLGTFGDQIQDARAQLNWMGTWFEVAVAIVPRPEIPDAQSLVKKVRTFLEENRRIGHRLKVDLPTYVPLQIEMTICVKNGYLRAHIQRELLNRFSDERNTDGTFGFFHPSRFTFGNSLYVSQLIAEAKKVRGVENVQVTRFERRGLASQGELELGILQFGPLEVPQMDNDPRRPERGSFCLNMRGVR